MCAAKLSIPRQYPGRHPTIGSSLSEVKDWLGKLPSKEVEKAVKMFLPALVELNRTELDSELRYQIMRYLARVSEHLVKKLRARYLVGNSQMVTWKSVQDSELVKRLLQETANGFKIVVDSVLNAQGAELDKNRLGCSIYHVMNNLGDYLLEHYLLYEPVAGGTWGELNLLYRITGRLDLQQWPLTLGEEERATIDEAYLRSLLLSAINPYRLMRTDVERACDVIGAWARLCRLEVREPGWEPAGEIVIDLASDKAPEYAKPGEPFTDLSIIRLVNLEGVGRGAEGLFHLDDQGDSALVKLKRDLLQQLRNGWRSDIQRSSVRRSSFAEMELAIGLRSCHLLFCGDQLQNNSDLLSLEAMCQEHDAVVEAYTANDSGPGECEGFDEPPDDDYYRNEMENPTIGVHVVKQMDVSMGGYGLKFDASSASMVKRGDLVSVRMMAFGDTPWRIGDVRWKRGGPDNSMMLGIRMLAETAESFYATVVTSSGLEGKVMRGLLIPADGFENPSASLLLPTEGCEEGVLLRVRTHDRRLKLKLVSRIDGGEGFSQFAYEIVPDQ